MNERELGRRVWLGHLILAGEVRAADIREAGYVDSNTGLKATVWLITYFVELMRERGIELAKITRRVPAEFVDPSSAPVGVERGKCYAFEIETVERKHGVLMARMASAEPALLGIEEAASPVDAPSGAAMGGAALNLV